MGGWQARNERGREGESNAFSIARKIKLKKVDSGDGKLVMSQPRVKLKLELVPLSPSPQMLVELTLRPYPRIKLSGH